LIIATCNQRELRTKGVQAERVAPNFITRHSRTMPISMRVNLLVLLLLAGDSFSEVYAEPGLKKDHSVKQTNAPTPPQQKSNLKKKSRTSKQLNRTAAPLDDLRTHSYSGGLDRD
jgi:hypothetical protein